MAGGRFVTAIGAAALTLAVLVAGFLLVTMLRQPVVAAVDNVTLGREGLSAAIEAEVTLLPRVRVTFEGLSGTLHVAEQRVDYEVEGLVAGDVLVPESEHHVVVRVAMGPTAIGAAVVRALGQGKLVVDFDGTVRVTVLGIPVSVPLHFERAVEP
jgi:hypothetical protein